MTSRPIFNNQNFKYTVNYSAKFKRDYTKSKKQGRDISKFETVISILATGQKLPNKYRNHRLKGDYTKCFECHIEPDWLLIYEIKDDLLILTLLHLGSHSDLFEE